MDATSASNDSVGRWFHLLMLLALTFGVAGCDRGPKRYSVSGQVVYEGAVVPAGRLVFTPDNTAGNRGPQGVAVIQDGKIVTELDRKVIGGPHWVQIMAFDGVPYEDGEGPVPHGRPLCPLVQAPVELPKHDAKLEIRVSINGSEPEVDISVENN